MPKRQFPVVSPALLALLALAGCGGGSNGTAPPGACGAAALDLAIGQPHTVTGECASEIAIVAGAGGAQYVAVAFREDPSGGSSVLDLQVVGLNFDLVASNAIGDAPSLQESVLESADIHGARPWAASPDHPFHMQLRARERREFSPQSHPRQALAASPSGGISGGARLAITSVDPQVGDLVTINAQARSACSNPIDRPGRIAAVSQRAVVVHDTENPADGFTDADYQSIAAAFDTLIHPVAALNFGTPSDIDGNGRSVIFYTREVNLLTEAGSGSFVGGFFFVRDLFPKTGDNPCPTSNEGELFYMLVPDPTGIHGNKWDRETVLRLTLGTIAHEYQHLINSSRRLFVNFAPIWEDVWLDEGLAHVAEELTFYRSAGLSPRTNIDLPRITGDAVVLNAFNRFMISNVGRLEDYLKTPHGNSPYSNTDGLGTRGAAWSFLRYAADRRGSSEQPFWMGLVNSQTAGLTNLQNALGTAPLPWFRDWATSTYLDDAIGSAPAQYISPSWNMRSIFTHEVLGGGYPLPVHVLSSGQTHSRGLVAGGASYARLSIGPGGNATIEFSAAGTAPPPAISVTLVRTQ
ncbi:MAG TPA: hypothetical protein VMM18_00810 [Gemmatimonadaceae bacterium]|nr:hypothetical protein [Gemmatimonadaceae bacterium]